MLLLISVWINVYCGILLVCNVVMITDVCVPLSALPDLIDETCKEIASMPHLACPIVAHAGDGNFHVLIFFDSASVKETEDAKQLANSMAMRAISMDGTCTGEHGVVRIRRCSAFIHLYYYCTFRVGTAYLFRKFISANGKLTY